MLADRRLPVRCWEPRPVGDDAVDAAVCGDVLPQEPGRYLRDGECVGRVDALLGGGADVRGLAGVAHREVSGG
jgi:hypothetical protein